jgi:hypothetical protein
MKIISAFFEKIIMYCIYIFKKAYELLTVEKRNAVFVDTALQYYKALKKT